MRRISLLLTLLVLLGSALAAAIPAAPAAPAAVSAASVDALLAPPGQTSVCPLCIIGYHCCAVGNQFRCFPDSKPCP